jgi:hypothetical protein
MGTASKASVSMFYEIIKDQTGQSLKLDVHLLDHKKPTLLTSGFFC